MTDDTYITPSPPAWKNEKLQIIDRLFQQYYDNNENRPEILKTEHLPREERKQIRTTKEFKQAAKKFYKSQGNIEETIRKTLLSIEDSDLLSNWVSQYIDKLEDRKYKGPEIFVNVDNFPFSFAQKLDTQTAHKLYDWFKERASEDRIQEMFPGLAEKVAQD